MKACNGALQHREIVLKEDAMKERDKGYDESDKVWPNGGGDFGPVRGI